MLKNKKKIGTASAPDILSYSLICTLYFKTSYSTSTVTWWVACLAILVLFNTLSLKFLHPFLCSSTGILQTKTNWGITLDSLSLRKWFQPSSCESVAAPPIKPTQPLQYATLLIKEVSHLETQPFSLQTIFTPLHEKLRWRLKGCCWKTYKRNNKPSLTLAAIIRYINLL